MIQISKNATKTAYKFNKNKSLLLLCLLLQITTQQLLEFSHRVSSLRYTFSGTSYGETVIYTYRNNLYYSNVFKSPYTEKSITLSDSSTQYSVHIATLAPYLIVADVFGNVYILNQNENLKILKKMKFNAIGRSWFFRSQVYGFENTNYFYLTRRDYSQKGSFFHDWSKDESQVVYLTSDNEIVSYSSFERVSLILSVKESGKKKVMKSDPTQTTNYLGSFTSTVSISAMIHLKGIGGYPTTHHFAASNEETNRKMIIYNSANNQFLLEKTVTGNNSPYDIVIIENTSYVGLALSEPYVFRMVKVTDMSTWEFTYGNGAILNTEKNYLRQAVYIKDTNYIWLGKDEEFDIYKILPPVCHKSCETCTKAALPNSCDTCPSGSVKSGGFCIPSSQNCQTALIPYYFPDTSTCAETCGDGYFTEPGNICAVCVPNCKSCSDRLNCDICKTGFEKDENNLCSQKCQTGKYLSGSSCNDCDDSCKGCKGPSNKDCTLCHSLVEVNVDGSCSYSCSAGMYWSDSLKKCSSCYSSCQTCEESSSGYNCLSCLSHLFTAKIEGEINYVNCLSSCPTGYYEGEEVSGEPKKCEKCPQGCEVCEKVTENQESKMKCSECETGYYLWESSCVQNCPEKTFKYDFSNPKSCRSCIENCLKCESETSCSECKSGYEVKEGTQICELKEEETENSEENNLKNSNQTDSTIYYNDETNDDGSSFALTFFTILALAVVGMILGSRKKTLERERAGRRNRNRIRGNNVEDAPLAEPFHPIIPEGETNPLEPVGISITSVAPSSMHTSAPLNPENQFLRRESFFEIKVRREETVMSDEDKPIVGGRLDFDMMKNIGEGRNLAIRKKGKRNGRWKRMNRGKNLNIGEDEDDIFEFDNFGIDRPYAPKPYVPPAINSSDSLPRIRPRKKKITEKKILNTQRKKKWMKRKLKNRD